MQPLLWSCEREPSSLGVSVQSLLLFCHLAIL